MPGERLRWLAQPRAAGQVRELLEECLVGAEPPQFLGVRHHQTTSWGAGELLVPPLGEAPDVDAFLPCWEGALVATGRDLRELDDGLALVGGDHPELRVEEIDELAIRIDRVHRDHPPPALALDGDRHVAADVGAKRPAHRRAQNLLNSRHGSQRSDHFPLASAVNATARPSP